ncbi:MAG: alginate export family protein [Bacteroidales bacterium]|nr:alginate export family protein [Bacteroidales bacterium]MCF8458141.1 alginate export family protein [Bacteroidales bacterium]
MNTQINLKTFLILVFCIGWSIHLYAQLSIRSEYRPRFEVRDGYQKLALENSIPTALVSHRLRLSFEYETENLKFVFTPQDVRIWGDEQLTSSTGVFGDNASLDLFEGYAEIKMAENTWVSVGRQQLVFDSKRLLGDRNWNQNGIAYDAVVLKCNPLGMNLHAGASWNTLADATSNNLYPTTRIKSLNFLWLNKKINERINLSLLHISSGITETDTTNTLNFRHTTGLYAKFKSDGLNIWANAYYQYGKSQPGRTVDAYLLDADISYKLGEITPGVGLGYLSGNNKTLTGSSSDKLFDVLYGNRHGYFGNMDYFRSFGSHTKQGGLADFFLYVDYKISKSINIKNTGHYFQLARTNPGTPENKNLGYENDLIVKYKFADWGTLEGGYLFFLPTESLKTIQSVQDAKYSQFVYLQLIITPVLVKQN